MPGSWSEASRRYRERRPYRRLFNNKRSWAERRGISFTLDYDSIDWPEVCPVLGITLNYLGGRGVNDPANVSFDRIDPTLGYTPENTVIVSQLANAIKHTATPDQIQRVAAFYGGDLAKWHAIEPPRSSE